MEDSDDEDFKYEEVDVGSEGDDLEEEDIDLLNALSMARKIQEKSIKKG